VNVRAVRSALVSGGETAECGREIAPAVDAASLDRRKSGDPSALTASALEWRANGILTSARGLKNSATHGGAELTTGHWQFHDHQTGRTGL